MKSLSEIVLLIIGLAFVCIAVMLWATLDGTLDSHYPAVIIGAIGTGFLFAGATTKSDREISDMFVSNRRSPQ